MIVVTGATGKLGRLVVDGLLKKVAASEVVAAVRSPEKATELKALGVQVREADYARPETLAKAVEGLVDGVGTGAGDAAYGGHCGREGSGSEAAGVYESAWGRCVLAADGAGS